MYAIGGVLHADAEKKINDTTPYFLPAFRTCCRSRLPASSVLSTTS